MFLQFYSWNFRHNKSPGKAALHLKINMRFPRYAPPAQIKLKWGSEWTLLFFAQTMPSFVLWVVFK